MAQRTLSEVGDQHRRRSMWRRGGICRSVIVGVAASLLMSAGIAFAPGAAATTFTPGEGSGPNWCGQYGGSNMASYDNVYACRLQQSGAGATPFDPHEAGFQCVELANRFLWAHWGISPVDANGVNFAETVANQRGKQFVPNDTPGAPYRPGDIVSFSGGYGGNGHTAVVIASSENSIGSGKVTVLDENNSWDAANPAPGYGPGTQQLTVSKWHLSNIGANGTLPATGFVALAGSAPPPSNPQTPTGKVVASPCLNFHNGVGGSAQMIGCIPENTVIPILCTATGNAVSGPYGTSSVWDQTQYGGQTGYVADAWVYTGTANPVAGTCSAPPPSAPPPSNPQHPTGKVVISSCLDLHSGVGHDTPKIGCIPQNTIIPILCTATGNAVSGPYGTSSVWDQTQYGGQTGYVADAWVYTGTNNAVAGTCSTPPPTPSPPATPTPTQSPSPTSAPVSETPYPTTLTMFATKTHLVAGAAVTLAGELSRTGTSGLPGRTIVLRAEHDGGLIFTLATTVTNALGQYRVTFHPMTNGRYDAYFAGDPASTSPGDAAAFAHPTAVTVGPKVEANPAHRKCSPRKPIVVTGSVAPNEQGGAATLEYLKHGKRRRLATTTIGPSSDFRFATHKLRHKGTYRLVVVVPARLGNTGGASAVFKVRRT